MDVILNATDTGDRARELSADNSEVAVHRRAQLSISQQWTPLLRRKDEMDEQVRQGLRHDPIINTCAGLTQYSDSKIPLSNNVARPGRRYIPPPAAVLCGAAQRRRWHVMRGTNRDDVGGDRDRQPSARRMVEGEVP